MENTSINEFLHYYDNIYKRTMKVIELIPEDKLEWRPQKGMFSFGDIIRHLFNLERYMFVESVLRDKNLYRGHEGQIQGSITEYASNLHQDGIKLLKSLTDLDLEKRCKTPDNIEIRRWKWLRAMIEHHVHHRAQLYTYLHMIGIPAPPIFGLTSEEVRLRSAKP